METPMAIAILKAVRDEVRGIRDDMREWREEWRRFRLARKEGEGVKRNEVEEFTSSEEEEKKPEARPEDGKKGKGEDGWEEWVKNEKVEERKGEVETSYRRTEESKEEVKGESDRGAFEMNWEREKWERELRRRNLRITGTVAEGERGRIELQTILGVAVGKRIEIQVVSRRIGRRGDPRIIVRLESAEIRDEILAKKKEISRQIRLGVEEDLTWTERATRYRLRAKAEEEWQRGKEVRLGKREVWIDGAKWWWEEREREWRRQAKAEGESDD